jgi:hypothetical protein
MRTICCATRRVPMMRGARSPQAPRLRDGWSGGIADKRSGHSADRTQHDGTRHRPERRIAGALLRSSAGGNAGQQDDGRNQSLVHQSASLTENHSRSNMAGEGLFDV